jgi:predicted CXXCH cytochrome family protein
MSQSAPTRDPHHRWKSYLAILVIFALAIALGGYLVVYYPGGNTPAAPPRKLTAGGRLTIWWDVLPKSVQQITTPSSRESNIHPADYVGPHECRKCHQGNYDQWAKHPHRWMNALASPETVRGAFNGAAIVYRGGKATFNQDGEQYRMRLERGDLRRTYAITQTIGSRFYQYYVGRQIEGPESASHRFYTEEHVLPFGYWLAQKEWVPVVHIGPELPDERRADPFAPPDEGIYYAEYATSCNYCHTTFPLGDLIGRRTHLVGQYAPVGMHWSMRKYIEQAHPETLADIMELMKQPSMRNPMESWDAAQHAVTFGVSCEACHLGAKAHVASGGKVLPKFLPGSPHLRFESTGEALDPGRTHDNVNWACGRCHTGTRPKFAAGMSTWNSVEYTDAMLGSCYSQLKCIDCHNPHRALGPKWSFSADHDDQLCLKCHETLKPAAARKQHTRHAEGSDGARCMNCHMPRVNEGIEDVVRTHMIYSPTRADMIEANHPNACNLCHTDKPIDWTLQHLKDWYGKTYDENRIERSYPNRSKATGYGWLKSGNPAVRLVATDAILRAKDAKALPFVINALDDPYLVNRQFAAKRWQEILGVRLLDFGYRFYMSNDERQGPLSKLRAAVRASEPPAPTSVNTPSPTRPVLPTAVP